MVLKNRLKSTTAIRFGDLGLKLLLKTILTVARSGNRRLKLLLKIYALRDITAGDRASRA